MKLSFPVDPTSGDSGEDFWVNVLNIIFMLKKNMQDTDIRLERTIIDLFGTGILYQSWTPPLIHATGGFNVTIDAHHYGIGFLVKRTEAAVVTIPASGTYYLWKYQDDVDGALHYGVTTANVNPDGGQEPEDSEFPDGTGDLLAIKMATIVTDGSGVTSIAETFDIIYPMSFYTFPTPGGFVPREEQFTTWDSLDRTDGTLDTCGPLSHVALSLPTPISIQRGDIMCNLGDTSQVVASGSPQSFTFAAGFKPIIGEKVTVRYFSAT